MCCKVPDCPQGARTVLTEIIHQATVMQAQIEEHFIENQNLPYRF